MASGERGTSEVQIVITAVDETADGRDSALAAFREMTKQLATDIPIQASDETKATRDEVAASWKELKLPPLEVTANDPITDAWRAKVMAEIKSVAKEALQIPVEADTEEFRAQLAEDLAAVKEFAREDIPVGIADADGFRLSVEELVAQVRAEVAGGIPVPVTAEAPTRIPASQVPDLSPQSDQNSGATYARVLTEPVLWTPLNDPYADAKAKIEASGPLEVPTQATNPVNDAFMAQVNGSLRSVAKDALQIPVEADMLPFQQQVEDVLMQIAEYDKADIPLEIGDAVAFRAQVQELVAQVSESVKAVIDIQVDDTGLTDLQAKTLASSQATVELVSAQQKLDVALQSGDEDAVAKARQELAAATQQADVASMELVAAQEATAEAEVAVAEATDTAAFSMGALNAAMGPVWMVMGAVQMAMFAFGSTTNTASSATQNLSQQIISLGQATGSSASSMLVGNQALGKINDELTTIGSSSVQFAQAFSGSVAQATTYTNGLEQAQQKLGATMVQVTEQAQANNKAGGEMAATTRTVSESIAQLAQQTNGDKAAFDALSPSVQKQIDAYRAYADVVPQAQQQLKALEAEQAIEKAQLDALNFSLSDGQSAWNEYGNNIQSQVKAFQNATSGLKYLFDSVDQADIAAGQAAQQWQQLNQAVTTAQQAYQQAAQGVANAEHSVEQASQGVAAARHSEEQSILAVQQAELQLANAQQAETNAQNNLTQARQAAADQLKSLQLQVADQANTEAAAQLRLFQAQQAVNAANLQGRTLSSLGPLSAANESSYQLLLNLAQAQAALNDAKNQGSVLDRQNADAQKAGVDGAAGVVSALQQLLQAQQGVQSATQGVSNAQYAQQQAALQVQNALYAQQQASVAVQTAQEAENSALLALTTAKDNATRVTAGNTLAAAQNRDTIEQLYEKNVAVYGPTMAAAQATEIQGEQAHFSAQQVDQVITSLGGLNGQVSTFSIVGTPSMNINALIGQAWSQGIDPALLGLPSSQPDVGGYGGGRGAAMSATGNYGPGGYAAGGPIGGSGGPTEDNQLIWASVGEHMWTAEEVQKAGGHQAVAALRSAIRGYASGGAIGPTMLRANGLMSMGDAAAMAIAGVMERFGQHPQPSQLPTSSGVIDFSSLAAASYGGYGGGSNVSGDRAANKAIMQAVFASYGWGSGPEWAAQDYVEMREAGYNNLAQNPTSTAFGMGQFLDSTWASYGFTKTADPRVQSIAMAEYEKARYNDPIGAAAHERAFNWYGGGGSAGSGGWIGVGEYGPELLRVPAGSSVMPASNTAAALAQAPQSLAVELHIAGDTDQALAVLLMRMMRERKIQIRSSWLTN